MANARKCDMCEKCYDPLEQEGLMCRFENPIFQNAHDLREGIVTRRLINGPPDVYIDLCPECSKKFMDLFRKDIPAYFFEDEMITKEDIARLLGLGKDEDADE